MLDGRSKQPRRRRNNVFLLLWPFACFAVAVGARGSGRPPGAATSRSVPTSSSSSLDNPNKTTKNIETTSRPTAASSSRTATERARTVIRAGSSSSSEPHPSPPLSSSSSSSSLSSETTSGTTKNDGQKKYSVAATTAIRTIDSLAAATAASSKRSSRGNKSSSLHDGNIPSDLTSTSESALMDGETNAIYWQENADVFSASVTRPYLSRWGVLHVRATILTALLWMWVWGVVSRYLAYRYFESPAIVVRQLSAENKGMSHPPPPGGGDGAGSFVFGPLARFALLLLHSFLYLRLPRYSPKVVFATAMLYLLESYTCGTRRYLSHAMDAPSEVQAYLERLRDVVPRVVWRVRCFHYEEREFWGGFRGIVKFWDGRKKRGGGGGEHSPEEEPAAPSSSTSSSSSSSSSGAFDEPQFPWMARKVVTHEAVGIYKFGRWEDHTLASTWRRAPRSYSSSGTMMEEEAPFGKVTLSKLLVLKDKDTREDYFAQQAAFVTLEGRKDVRAEFATTIEVDGFRPKLLAVRPVRRIRGSKRIIPSAALFRQHVYILFTLLGLSLPYRIWFARHCDEIRVTVVKETSIEESRSAKDTKKDTVEKSSSWFPLPWGWGSSQSLSATERAQESFRRRMRELSLYDDEEESSAASTVDGSSATMRDANSVGDREEALADEASTSESAGPNDRVVPADSQPASPASAQPSMGSPTSPSQDVR